MKVNQHGGFTFDITVQGNFAVTVDLSVPGEHNVLNSLGVFTALSQMGFAPSKIASALNRLRVLAGVLKLSVKSDGITVIDDYAHHPAKIQATLAAARNRYPSRRIVAVWQPHTYSRTKALEAEFIASFHNADLVIVSEIYASREKLEEYSSRKIAEEVTYT